MIGWNALVLGAGAAVARPLASLLARRFGPAGGLAGATAVAQALSGGLWLAIVALGLRGGSRMQLFHEHGQGRFVLLAGLALPLWLLGIAVETLVAWGLGRFVARVRPDLLPGGVAPASAPAVAGGAAR